MSRYVPPHRKRADESDNNDISNEATQREAWQALNRSITGIINRVSADNLQVSVTELFRENIIRGRGLLCRSLMRAQLADPDLTNVFAALVSCVNKELSAIGLLLLKRLVVQWWRYYRRKDWTALRSVSRFLAWLYIFNVVHVDLIYQIILTHLTSGNSDGDGNQSNTPNSNSNNNNNNNDDIDQAAAIFRETFRSMSERNVAEFHEHVLTPFRDMLAMDSDAWRLSPRAQTLLESCLREVQEWERVKFTANIIPPELLLVELSEQKCHTEIDLDDGPTMDAEEKLDRFVFDKEYEAHEEVYETARRAILGENWETELLEQVAAAEEADEEAEELERTQQQEQGGKVSVDTPKQLIDEHDRQVRKEVYMALRSSVRADEVVHKILKTMQPQTERTVCFMVIEGCCEESSYKNVYGMVAERLCKSNAKFQGFFAEAFRLRYENAEDLEEKQIEYTCKIYTHLLRTNSIPWHKCLFVFDIVNSNVSQRLMIQWLLQGLVETLGMRTVRERFEKDRELRSSTTKLFPIIGSAEDMLEWAVNMFEAMGVGELGFGLRARLEELRSMRRGTHLNSNNNNNNSDDGGSGGNMNKKRPRDNMMEYV
ncbi:Initiation factor eIF-4 gamma [Trypanosoma melophagium]|uniref:Initiation factor eIF-4 gamma n=1 Tax=Trypanosoma melophagium TaxID=715481 RepID=UPI00351A9546|nr:Initiation factor eIF-4 gamma [Trypanosoma melophagium]